MVAGAIAIGIFAIFLYTLPSVIACASVHPSRTGIYFVNLLLGWTGLGWIIAMIWALAGLNVRVPLLVDADTSGQLGLLSPIPADPKLRDSRLLRSLEIGGTAALIGFLAFAVINHNAKVFQNNEPPSKFRADGPDGGLNSDASEKALMSMQTMENHDTTGMTEAVETKRTGLVPVVAKGVSVVPGAIICSDMNTLSMVFDLYTSAWEEHEQDILTKGQSRLIQGEPASAPDPTLYGCNLLPPGTPMMLEPGKMVPVVTAQLPDGTTIKGVTLESMIAHQ